MRASYIANEALRELILLQEYVGDETLPPVPGWGWYDLCEKLSKSFPELDWSKQFEERKMSQYKQVDDNDKA